MIRLARPMPLPLAAVLLLLALAPPAAAPAPIPRIQRAGNAYRLIVDGQPFLLLGGQSLNENSVKPEDLERVWKALVGVHANTAIIPIWWKLIEPQPGRFDFSQVDRIVDGARRNGLRLVLLWFATWKNGDMLYTPDWVKNDRATYPRAIGLSGEELFTLTPFGEATRQADVRAFTAVMRHLRETDPQRTVIMMQVENEPGLMGADRDRSAQASRLFDAPVPAELMAYLARHRDQLSPALRQQLARANFRPAGTWTQVFGRMAAEAFSAWFIARYIDTVAAAGKQVYPLPMYANAWLVEPHAERPGRYPSGGPTDHVIDIWKAAAPHLDLIAPDIYYPKYYEAAAPYARPDNPLFVPEVNFQPFFGALAFMTFATFDGLCFSPYGLEEGVDNAQAWSARAAEFEDTYRVLRPLLPVIARHQYQRKLHAVIQGVSTGEDWMLAVRLADDRIAAMVEFTAQFNPIVGRGRGIIIELAPDDYVIAGAGFKVSFRHLAGPLRDAQLLSLEEGTFAGEKWVRARRLNGDELHVELPAKAKILRARLDLR